MKDKNSIAKNNFSLETIKRLSLYLRNLKRLYKSGMAVISSDKITQFLNVSSEQFRKDLSYFGGFGKRGVGYRVDRLIQEIENILGVNKQWNIAIVGVGKLGSALLGFEGFSKFNLNIAYAFDAQPAKIGKRQDGILIEDVKNLKQIVKKNNIRVAIISTPPEVAQEISDELVSAGIRGILNLAPIVLRVPDYVFVSNVDMACELESLIFFCQKEKGFITNTQ